MCSTEICSPRDGPCVEGCFGQWWWGKWVLCPQITHPTLMNSGRSHENNEWASLQHVLIENSLRKSSDCASIRQQVNDLVMRGVLNYLLRLIHFLFFSYDMEEAWSCWRWEWSGEQCLRVKLTEVYFWMQKYTIVMFLYWLYLLLARPQTSLVQLPIKALTGDRVCLCMCVFSRIYNH